MSRPAQPVAADAGPALSAAQVAEWLRHHPDFLTDHPDLVEVLTPPSAHQGAGVVDLQRFMVQRLQGENARLYDAADELITAGRSNMSAQSMTHRAVLALLEATGFDHFVHIATQDCPELLDVDVITLSVESDGPLSRRFAAAGMLGIRPGDIDALVGEGVAVNLRPASRDCEAIFGPATDLVKSDALARLSLGKGSPQVLLALGGREPGKFHPGQGTENLGFFARAVELCLRSWLARPNG
jgi:uncharacterized protein YigA (DUF484 family)